MAPLCSRLFLLAAATLLWLLGSAQRPDDVIASAGKHILAVGFAACWSCLADRLLLLELAGLWLCPLVAAGPLRRRVGRSPIAMIVMILLEVLAYLTTFRRAGSAAAGCCAQLFR